MNLPVLDIRYNDDMNLVYEACHRITEAPKWSLLCLYFTKPKKKKTKKFCGIIFKKMDKNFWKVSENRQVFTNKELESFIKNLNVNFRGFRLETPSHLYIYAENKAEKHIGLDKENNVFDRLRQSS